MSSGRLTGKVAIVTGAGGGFGRVLVRALLTEGARVAAFDVDPVSLEGLKQELHEIGKGELFIRTMDIGDWNACAEATADAVQRLGGLHILINNGALGMRAIREDHFSRLVGIHEITPQVWQRFVAVNFSGAWHMTRAAIGWMLDQRWGRIINVTTSFFTMLRGGFHPYGPCKAGLEAMSCGHAEEFRDRGITVNVVVPGGPADTPMVPEESGFRREDLVPPGAMVAPIVWLCSDAAKDVSGNRYVAKNWDATVPQAEAEKRCREPIAWPELARNPVWPGGRPGN
jgi:NAD(P)-dependent dehydrogenase (short-subunit alcohol dehydrogenase family)